MHPKSKGVTINTLHHEHSRHGRSHGNTNNIGYELANTALDVDGLEDHLREVRCRLVLRARAVPAVLGEALLARLGHVRTRAVERSRDDRAANAGSPVVITRAGIVTHGGDIVAVLDHGIALGVVVVELLESRGVGLENVGRVGEVDDERRYAASGQVACVTTEKGWAVVEAEIDKGVLIGYVWEGGAVLDTGVAGTLVCCNERCTVGPVLRRVRGFDGVCG